METWILVANASQASLYSTENLRTKDLKLLEKFDQKKSRLKKEGLISDRSGNYHAENKQGSAYERSDPKEAFAHTFAHHLSKRLTNRKEQFKELIIVAAPHFYGLMKKSLNKIDHHLHINKDYTQLKERELLKELRESIFP